jgi:hypothetical protein
LSQIASIRCGGKGAQNQLRSAIFNKERNTTMHIGIHHIINDAQKWEQGKESVMSNIQGGTLPAGMKPVFFIPATNQQTAFCVW